MSLADPWDEVPRLESLLEGDLMDEAKRSALHERAEEFCSRRCKVDDRCRYVEAIESRADCPLWMFLRTDPTR